MCINTSNFFTRSHPIWERRGSLTLPALLALPRLGGGDPGRSEVRTPLQGGPILRAAPRLSAGAGTPSRHHSGLSGSGPPWAQGVGVICSPPWLLFTGFFLRHLGSTWRFNSLGDNLLPPNEDQRLSWIPQIKLAWPWLRPVWISHLPNDFMSRTQRVNFLLTFPIAAVSILL